MSELLKKLNLYGNDLEDTKEALRLLNLPPRGQGTGFYLRSYAQGYNLLKPVFEDLLRWDKTLNGREVLRQLLIEHKKLIISGRNLQVRENDRRTRENNRRKKEQVSIELSFNYIKITPLTADNIYIDWDEELKRNRERVHTGSSALEQEQNDDAPIAHFVSREQLIIDHFIDLGDEMYDLRSNPQVLLDMKFIIYTKKLIFNSKQRNITKNKIKVINNFYDKVGGVQYALIFNVSHITSQTITVFNPLTVPLRASGASTLQLFNKQGELMVDNIDEGSGTCVVDFIFNNYVKKYSRKYGGNGKFPHMTKDEIADDITSGWISTNKQSPNPLLKDCAPPKFEEYDAKKDGVCVLQLAEFCYTNKITLQCLDAEFNIFHTRVYKNASRESMMVIISDGHIYNIKDKTLRKTVQNSGRGAVHMAILENKEKLPLNELTDNTVRTEINYDDISDIQEKNIFITGEKDLEDLYIQLWAKENSKYAYKNNCNLMTQILLKDKNIFYNPDYEAVLDICKNLKIPFDNQSLISVGLDLYQKVNPDFQLSNFYSYFNSETSQFFQSARRDNWVTSYKDGKEYDLKDVSSVDICKCYSSILRSDIDWMCFSSLDEVKTYTGQHILQHAFYYIATNATVLFQGTGVYMGELVQIGLDDGIITSEDIKFYISTKQTTKGKFKPFVDYVFENCGENAKYIINTFIGSSLGKTLKNVGKVRYTDNLNSASTAFFTQASPLKERGTGSKEGDEVMNVFY